jgi:uncharacterized Fe-S center protein
MAAWACAENCFTATDAKVAKGVAPRATATIFHQNFATYIRIGNCFLGEGTSKTCVNSFASFVPVAVNSCNSAQNGIDFASYSLYDAGMKSIREILREEMEECTQIRANEVAILRFFQASAARKRPESVELEEQELLIGGDR